MTALVEKVQFDQSKCAAPAEQIVQRVRVVAKLTAIRADDRTLRLALESGQEVDGFLVKGLVEQLETLRNQSITIDGTAVFLPSGQLVRVEAEAFRVATDADRFFNKLPKVTNLPSTLFATGLRNAAALREIFGRWPGDETDEQIEAALGEIS